MEALVRDSLRFTGLFALDWRSAVPRYELFWQVLR